MLSINKYNSIIIVFIYLYIIIKELKIDVCCASKVSKQATTHELESSIFFMQFTHCSFVHTTHNMIIVHRYNSFKKLFVLYYILLFFSSFNCSFYLNNLQVFNVCFQMCGYFVCVQRAAMILGCSGWLQDVGMWLIFVGYKKLVQL